MDFCKYINNCSVHNYDVIYALEPDDDNFIKLSSSDVQNGEMHILKKTHVINKHSCVLVTRAR